MKTASKFWKCHLLLLACQLGLSVIIFPFNFEESEWMLLDISYTVSVNCVEIICCFSGQILQPINFHIHCVFCFP